MDDGTADFDMGVIELGTYVSDFSGMKFTLPESWDFYDGKNFSKCPDSMRTATRMP